MKKNQTQPTKSWRVFRKGPFGTVKGFVGSVPAVNKDMAFQAAEVIFGSDIVVELDRTIQQ